MSEQQREHQASASLSPHEFAQEILPTLTERLPPLLCKHVHVVPFVPLHTTAAENIIKVKIRSLARQLESRYKIELNCAPEITLHLAREALASSMDKALKQLYFAVEQAVLHQIDNPNRANQLYLQLNETGRLLRCDWISNAARA
jgi:ATP-dependent Clp protease ATP-binding subunit ClpA